MHRLLVPVDNSDNAMRALEHAIRLTKEIGNTELVIVYAHEPPIIYGEIELYLSESKARELQQAHSEGILRPAIEKARESGVNFTNQILIGDVAESIVSAAESSGCDGIVMGTRAMSAIGNLVMGSIATKVIQPSFP
jgi:nucleotide-binding universal stress UspA family protein